MGWFYPNQTQFVDPFTSVKYSPIRQVDGAILVPLQIIRPGSTPKEHLCGVSSISSISLILSFQMKNQFFANTS